MSDQRSVMKEFRFLDQKRQTTGLSAEEATRYAQLRDLVGPDTAAPPRAGFDVNAAAARLRESLLPGGLRSPVPPADLQPEPEPQPVAEPEVEVEMPPEATALEAAWEAQPFAPLDVEPAPAADPLFDPASLGAEVRPQAWNPEAPGYDPAAPYDEAAWIAAGYDPNATYDWSAYYPEGQAPQAETAPLEEAAAPPAPVDEVEAVVLGDVEGGAVELPGEPAEEGPAAEELPFDPHAPFDHAKWFGRSAPTEPAAAFDAAPLELEGDPAGVPELEPLAEVTLEADLEAAPEPEPEAALTEAEAAWAAAEAHPIEIAEEVDLEAAPSAPSAADAVEADRADPYALEAAQALASAPPEPYAVEAPEPYAAEVAVEPEAASQGAAWAEPAPEPIDLGESAPETAPEEIPEPLLVPEEGDLQLAAPAEAAPSDTWFDATTEPPPAAPIAFGEYDAEVRGAPAGLAALLVEPLPEPPPPAAEAVDLVGDGSATPYQAAPEGAPFGEYDESAPASAPALALEDAALSALPFDPAAASAIEPGALPEGYDVSGPSLDPASLPPPPAGGYDEAAFPADAAYGGPEGDALPGGTPLELGEPAQDWLPEQALEQGFELASDGSFGELDRPAVTPVPGWVNAPAAAAMGWESPPPLDLAEPFEPAQPAAAPELAPEPPAEELPTLAAEDILEELPPGPAPLAAEGEAAPEPAALADEDAPEPTAEYAPAPAEAAYQEAEAPVAAEPYEGEIPPEIAAAFGDSPAPAAAAAEPWPAPEEAPPAVVQPEPEPYLEPEPLPTQEAAPQVWIEGSHRVVLHTVDGQVKRGLLVDAALDALELALQPQGSGAPETVGTDNVKAIFFMLAPGEKAAAPAGRKVRVTFRDGRQVAGYSPDYGEGTIGFFMIPADTRTNTGRIWVYQSAVRQVAVS